MDDTYQNEGFNRMLDDMEDAINSARRELHAGRKVSFEMSVKDIYGIAFDIDEKLLELRDASEDWGE